MRVCGIPLGVLCQRKAAVSNLLLNFDGADNSNIFLDSSPFNHVVTAFGTAIQSAGKGVFDGNGYVYTDTLPHFLDHNFIIIGKFSIPAWPNGYEKCPILGYLQSNQFGLYIGPGADSISSRYKKLYFLGGSVTFAHHIDIALNVEHSFKLERQGSVFRLFMDDVESTASGFSALPMPTTASRFCIGDGGYYRTPFVGKIDDIDVKIFS